MQIGSHGALVRILYEFYMQLQAIYTFAESTYNVIKLASYVCGESVIAGFPLFFFFFFFFFLARVRAVCMWYF